MVLRRLALSTGTGVLLALAFPQPHWGLLAWVALVPLLMVALEAKPAAAFGWGFVSGAVFFSITVSWLYGFFRSYGEMSVATAAGVLGLMVAILSLYPAAYALAVRWMTRTGTGWALAVSPFFWVALELGRGHMPAIGFPWNLLGYAVSDRLGLVQLVTLTGIYGLSFVVAAYNALLLWAWRERGAKAIGTWAAVTAALVLTITVGGRLVPRPAGQHASYASNWEQQNAAEFAAIDRLTIDAGRSAPGLIIWPEAPAPFSFEDPWFVAQATKIAQQSRSDFLAGVDEWTYPRGAAPQAANSAVMVDAAGRRIFRYDKIHLVPFGEYVPWRRWLWFARRLTGGIGDFTPGSERTVGRMDGGTFAVFICYEAIFPNEVRQFADRGAELLVNISDDGWYGHSKALAQHLNMARVRAVENRRWLLRDTNTGLTAVIDPYGRIRGRLPPDTRAALTARYDFRSGRTLYTRWGDWWPKLAILVSLLALAWNFARRDRKVRVG
jgi:apolipoprotein N-acyltransferase